MTQPQQPYGPQQPQQPAPQSPKQNTGRNIALGCVGAFLGGLLLLGGCAAIVTSDSDSGTSSSGTSAPVEPATTSDDQPADTPENDTPENDAEATHDLITAALQMTWDEQSTDGQNLMCSGWAIDRDRMIDAFMAGVGEQDMWSEDDIRAAATDFLDAKCGV